MDVQTEILVKGGLTLLAVVAVGWRHLRPGSLDQRQAGQGLILVAIAAALAYVNFGMFHGRSGIHHWEHFHYFLGSKYFPEVRYDGLYAASLAAERELNLATPVQSHIRDLRTNEVVPRQGITDHMREVKDRFSASRWRDFVADTRYFLTSNRAEYIAKIRKDHGYNPTPTWTFVARLFSRWLPASDSSLSALAWLDPLLLAAMFVLVFTTYGSRVGCLALVLFGLGYPWRFDWVGGAFLRQDWLAAVVAAICLMRRGRFLISGSLIGYAAMVRVFPAGFLLGPTVVAAHHLCQGKPVSWYRRLIVGVVASVALCLLIGGLTGAGIAAWPEFSSNLEKHHGTWLTNNVGLKNVLLYDLATMRREDVNWSSPEPWLLWQGKMTRLERDRAPLLVGATVALLAMIAVACWRYQPDEGAVIGTAVAFAVVVLTCYYWVMLLLVPLGPGRWRPAAGLLLLNVGLYGLHLATPSFEMIYGIMSWALLVFFLAWLGPDAWRTLRARDGAGHRLGGGRKGIRNP